MLLPGSSANAEATRAEVDRRVRDAGSFCSAAVSVLLARRRGCARSISSSSGSSTTRMALCRFAAAMTLSPRPRKRSFFGLPRVLGAASGIFNRNLGNSSRFTLPMCGSRPMRQLVRCVLCPSAPSPLSSWPPSRSSACFSSHSSVRPAARSSPVALPSPHR